MPSSRPLGTLGDNIQSRSVALFGSRIAAIRYLVQNCFGIRICTCSTYHLTPVNVQVNWTSVVSQVSLSSQVAGCAR